MKKHNNNPPKVVHPINAHIGERLGIKRIEKGFTRNELADYTGMSYYRIKKYEEGKSIPLHVLYELAKALQVKPGWFFWNFREEVETIGGVIHFDPPLSDSTE